MEFGANTSAKIPLEFPPYLKDYLNKAFPVNKEELVHVIPKVISHFWEEYKVHVKPKGDLFLFKYAQSLCDRWDVPGISECRGVIVRRGMNQWEYKSRPFNKFFNQNEGASPVKEEKDFNKLVSSFWFFEKADGSCIQLWNDESIPSDYQENCFGNWRVSTLGKIEPDAWVPQLFWKLFPSEKTKLLKKGFTYLFEMCTNENRVVTTYSTDRLVLIGTRNIETGAHLNKEELDHLGLELQVERPRAFQFSGTGIKSLREAKEFVEKEAKKREYGVNPEGFVVYFKDVPLCKFKNNAYVQKHGIITGDLLNVRNIVLDRFWEDTLDDVADALQQHPPILKFIEELKQKVENLLKEVDDIRKNIVLPALEGKEIKGRKEFAYVILKIVVSNWQGFFFQNMNDIINKEKETVGDIAFQWLRVNYMKWKGSFWKETKVAELLDAEKNVYPRVLKDEEDS